MVDYYILEHLILEPVVDTEVVLEEHNLVVAFLAEAFLAEAFLAEASLALDYHIVVVFLELELGIDLAVVFLESLEHFEEHNLEEPYLVVAYLVEPYPEEHNLVEVVEVVEAFLELEVENKLVVEQLELASLEHLEVDLALELDTFLEPELVLA